MEQIPYSPNSGYQPDERPISHLSIWSMVLGILFLCFCPLALIPLIMGIVGITMTGARGAKRGMGFAVAGTSLGAVGLLGTCMSAGILLPAIGAARETADKLRSATMMRMQLRAAIQYAEENEGMFPLPDQWPDAVIDLGLLDSTMLVSPLENGDGVSYIYLGGEYTFDADQIVIYEDPKHIDEGVNVGFADGHVEFVSHTEFERMLEEQTAP